MNIIWHKCVFGTELAEDAMGQDGFYRCAKVCSHGLVGGRDPAL